MMTKWKWHVVRGLMLLQAALVIALARTQAAYADLIDVPVPEEPSPETGAGSQAAIWLIALVVVLAIAAVLVVMKRRKSKEA